MHRLTAGNFNGDPDRYVADILREAVENRTETKTLELKDGRVIALVSRPMRGGGWLATHTDVTEQLAAEKERTRCASARSDGAPLTRRSVRFAPASKAFSRQ